MRPLEVHQRAWLLRAIAEIDQVHAIDPVAEVVEDERLVIFRGADRNAVLLLAQHGLQHLPRAWGNPYQHVGLKRVKHLRAKRHVVFVRAGKAPHAHCRGRARRR